MTRRTAAQRLGALAKAGGVAACLLSTGLFSPGMAFSQTDTEPQDLAPADAVQTAPTDPAAPLTLRRDGTRSELDALSKTITLSRERAVELENGIAELEKTSVSLRDAIVESADKRKALEQQILIGEQKLSTLRDQEETVHVSLRERRGVLAEVLAALQRMGRNPPPALLVTPEDALGSVRSAILLGAVVPGIRQKTDKLAADLQALASVKQDILKEKQSLASDMAGRLEEERRMDLLIAEKQKLKQQSAGDLAAERRKAEQLATQATSLEGLIGSLENEIASVRDATELARAKEEERRRMSDAQRAEARALANNGVPDKNRIAPAYPFSELQKKLALPVAGSVLRRFGDADGTGHTLQGMMLETGAGAVVTAPSDGWIVFAGTFRSYGQIIILNPGDGYHIVLSGMESVNVQQGQFVVTGEPLGMMGAKRVASAAALALETDRPTLYIELRKDGKPVDSQPWWTAANTGKARNDS